MCLSTLLSIYTIPSNLASYYLYTCYEVWPRVVNIVTVSVIDTCLSYMERKLNMAFCDESRCEKFCLKIYIFGSVAFPICEYVLSSEILTTRGSHSYKIQQIFANKNSYKHSFLPSIIPIWNSLPEYVIESSSLQLFKSNLNNYSLQ